MPISNENILIEGGLSEDQALVYQSLLERGPQKASNLTNWTGIKRGLTYKILEQLENMGLVSKKGGKGAVTTFSASHPSLLLNKLEKDKKNLELATETVKYGLGSFISQFNLQQGKPNIQFFEGKEGIEKVLEDTLTSQTEILTYVDMEIVEKYFKEINDEYVIKREKKNIQKRILAIENEFSINLFSKWYNENPDFFKVTNIKMAKTPITEIEGAIQIYDDKIGIITVSDTNLISIIIEDARISKLFKSMFEALYSTSPSFTP